MGGNRRIATVAVKVVRNYIKGLRLLDGQGEVIGECEWGNKSTGKWVSRRVPIGYEIIGL